MNQLSIVAIALVELHGLSGQKIDINPAEVVSVRKPRVTDQGYISKNVRCLITLADGKFVSIVDECDVVERKLGEVK